MRQGLRGVAAWEAEAGALTAEEIAAGRGPAGPPALGRVGHGLAGAPPLMKLREGSVYGVGALRAAARGDRIVWAVHRAALANGIVPVVPAGAIAEAFRTEARGDRLEDLLAGTVIEGMGEDGAKRVGELAARADTADLVAVATAETACPSQLRSGGLAPERPAGHGGTARPRPGPLRRLRAPAMPAARYSSVAPCPSPDGRRRHRRARGPTGAAATASPGRPGPAARPATRWRPGRRPGPGALSAVRTPGTAGAGRRSSIAPPRTGRPPGPRHRWPALSRPGR